MARRRVGGGGFGRFVQPCLDPLQAGFRIDQELRRDNHFLAGLQAALDFGLPARFDPRLNLHGPEFAVFLRDHHYRALAGLDDSLCRDQQHVVSACVHELHGHEHARHESRSRVVQFEAGFERTRCGVDLWQDCLNPAFE